MSQKSSLGGWRFLKTVALIVVVIALPYAIIWGLKLGLGSEVPLAAVESRSMEPTLKPGDLIVVKGVKPGELKVGDIILFKDPLGRGRYIVHRIVGIVVNNGRVFYRTKGDNNPSPDPWKVSEDLVVGKVVWVIPYLGYISLASGPNKATIAFILIFMIILVILWPKQKEIYRSGGQG